MLIQETYLPNVGQVRAASRVGHVVFCPSVSGVAVAPAPVHPSAPISPAQRPAPVAGAVGKGWTRGVASTPKGIAGAERTAAAGKARTQQPNDLFDLMNRRASRPWRPPH